MVARVLAVVIALAEERSEEYTKCYGGVGRFVRDGQVLEAYEWRDERRRQVLSSGPTQRPVQWLEVHKSGSTALKEVLRHALKEQAVVSSTALPRPRRTVHLAVLREPMSRLFSEYNYHCQQGNEPIEIALIHLYVAEARLREGGNATRRVECARAQAAIRVLLDIARDARMAQSITGREAFTTHCRLVWPATRASGGTHRRKRVGLARLAGTISRLFPRKRNETAQPRNAKNYCGLDFEEYAGFFAGMYTHQLSMAMACAGCTVIAPLWRHSCDVMPSALPPTDVLLEAALAFLVGAVASVPLEAGFSALRTYVDKVFDLHQLEPSTSEAIQKHLNHVSHEAAPSALALARVKQRNPLAQTDDLLYRAIVDHYCADLQVLRLTYIDASHLCPSSTY